MRRFPFFLAPLLGIVALFILVKVLFMALVGLAVFGLAFAAVRAIAARRFHHAYQVAAAYQQPLPVDGNYREFGFASGASQQRFGSRAKINVHFL